MTAEERRAQLLDVTKAIAAERGFHAISLEAVAREAGVTRPLIYGHFRDLSALLEALIEREHARALSQLDTVVPAEPPPGTVSEQLLASLGAFLEVGAADPRTWRLVLMAPEGAPELLRERIAAGRDAVVARLAELVRPGFGAGRTADPELTARLLAAFAEEAVRLLLTDPDHYPPERILRHARWMLDQLAPGAG